MKYIRSGFEFGLDQIESNPIQIRIGSDSNKLRFRSDLDSKEKPIEIIELQMPRY